MPFPHTGMVSWAKDATEFVVSVLFIARTGSSYDCIPKPIQPELDNPTKVKYAIKNAQVLVSNADLQ